MALAMQEGARRLQCMTKKTEKIDGQYFTRKQAQSHLIRKDIRQAAWLPPRQCLSSFNPEVKVTAWVNHARRSHRNRTAAGTHSQEEWIARVSYFGWLCRYCGIRLTENTLVKDHQLPLARGGSNWPANLVPSCQNCNCRKHTKHPIVFMLEMRFNLERRVLPLPL